MVRALFVSILALCALLCAGAAACVWGAAPTMPAAGFLLYPVGVIPAFLAAGFAFWGFDLATEGAAL